MADTYDYPVSQFQNDIATKLGNSASPEARGLIDDILGTFATGASEQPTAKIGAFGDEDAEGSGGATDDIDIASIDSGKSFNAGTVQGAGLIVMSGTGTLSGHSAATRDQTIAATGQSNLNLSVTGDHNITIIAGAGQVTATVQTTQETNFVGGTGNVNFTSAGSGAAHIDLQASTSGTVSTGSGSDNFRLKNGGNYEINGGGGNNVAELASLGQGKQGLVPANSQDGYKLSIDDHNRIVLDDGRGHVSKLANIDVVQFSNGSTFVKASTADEAIIARMYEAVLDRTADAAGIYNWWDAYNSGQLSLQQVGSSFLNSEEAQSKGFGSSVDNTTFVTNLYRNLMGREPDAEGLMNWASALNSGALSRSDVLIRFTASDEGAAANAGTVLLSTVSGAGQDYTPHTFNVVPDGSQTVAGGAGFDVVNFAGKKSDFATIVDIDRVTVFNASTNSTTAIDHAEYIKFGDGSVMINAANTDQAVIARMYDAVLNRDADADGLHNWWTAHDNGMSLQDIAHSFLTSPEFQAQSSNLSDTAFVSLMYQNMFGRAPDQGGLASWTDALSHGMSREDVVVNIAKSLEGASHSADTIKIIDHTH